MDAEELRQYLEPTRLIDSTHAAVIEQARRLTAGCASDRERLERIYYFVRDIPYDILAAFRDLAAGRGRASDVLQAGHAFCMGKASSFVALCRAAGIPARVGFQQLHCPDKPFMSEEVRRLWGDRPLPRHSLGEAYLDGRWLKLDATIDAATAAAKGRPYTRQFDGLHDIPTVEGPIVKDLESHADYPPDVAAWYETMSREVMRALDAADARDRFEVLDRVVGHVLDQDRVDRQVGPAAQHHGVAVGRCILGLHHAQAPIGAGEVLHRHGLAQRRRQVLGDETRRGVAGAARRERRHQPDGPRRPVAGLGVGAHAAQQRQGRCAPDQVSSVHVCLLVVGR